MRIFLTGATGFVGRALSLYFMQKDVDIVCLVHDADPRVQVPIATGMTTIFGNITDFQLMRRILYDYQPDAIIHLAAIALVDQAARDPYSTFDVNTVGTVRLLSAMREAAPLTYFIYFSTDKVYGDGRSKKETDPVAATGVYETSKASADLIAQAHLEKYPVAITRTCNIYGPGDWNSRVIPNTIRTCMRGENPVAYINTGIREYIYVEDVCKAIDKLVESRSRGIWNIGTGQLKTNKEVVSEIVKHFSKTHFTEASRLSYNKELMEQSLDTSKFDNELYGGHRNVITFEEGIRRTTAWWKKEIKSPSYKPATMIA